MYKRETRKESWKESGIENFGFDMDEELRIYYFLCGTKLSRGEWKRIDSKHKFYTYSEWNAYVKEKYCSEKREGLLEFRKYLEQRHRMVSIDNDSAGIIVTALVSAAIATVFSGANFAITESTPLQVVCYILVLGGRVDAYSSFDV